MPKTGVSSNCVEYLSPAHSTSREGAGAVTITFTVAEWERESLLPVTVMEKLPIGASSSTQIVSSALLESFSLSMRLGVLSLARIPSSNAEERVTVRFTLPAKPML